MKLYTHSGKHHADEIFALVTCQLAGVVTDYDRLKSLNNIPTDGIVADIGRVYNPELLMFDHHQQFLRREKGGPWHGYPYASFGLVWEHFGKKAISNVTGSIDMGVVQKVWYLLTTKFVLGIDAHDSDKDYKLEGECCEGRVEVVSVSAAISIMDDFKQALEFAQNLLSSFIKREFERVTELNKLLKNKPKFFEREQDSEILNLVLAGIDYLTDEWLFEYFPNAKFVVSRSNHPDNPYMLKAVKLDYLSRKVKKTIERSPDFDGYIHLGKHIAGASIPAKLIGLAKWNLNIKDEEVEDEFN